jgi:UDP-N-acetylmuramoyl-tripeptide--D-alanyl-D-alanine ligase
MIALWTGADLAAATGGRLLRGFDATGVAIDTRTLAAGDLFVALLGENRDGHAFVADALARGAAGAMVARQHADQAAWGPDAPLLAVEDTLQGLTALGAAGRARFAGRVAAITGSVGKTTTKEMLRAILAAQAPTHAAAASHNNQWGVPLTLARLPAGARFCVAELGMNHAGEIEPLARLVRPHVAVITAIAAAHIGHLGSIEAIADEKAAILRGLEPGGTAVLPADSAQLPRLLAAARATGVARLLTFGAAPEAEVRLAAADPDADGIRLRAAVGDETVALRLAAPGRHMAVNALAALAAAVALGVAPAAAAAALDGFAPVAGRGARRDLPVPGGAVLLLDESYNANGASMRAALAVLAQQHPARRVAVLGDMLELGAHGPAEHAALAPDVAAAADCVFACGPLMRHLCAALPAELPVRHAADAAALAALVVPAIRPGDAVLVKGSLGSNMKLIVAALARLAEAG